MKSVPLWNKFEFLTLDRMLTLSWLLCAFVAWVGQTNALAEVQGCDIFMRPADPAGIFSEVRDKGLDPMDFNIELVTLEDSLLYRIRHQQRLIGWGAFGTFSGPLGRHFGSNSRNAVRGLRSE